MKKWNVAEKSGAVKQDKRDETEMKQCFVMNIHIL